MGLRHISVISWFQQGPSHHWWNRSQSWQPWITKRCWSTSKPPWIAETINSFQGLLHIERWRQMWKLDVYIINIHTLHDGNMCKIFWGQKSKQNSAYKYRIIHSHRFQDLNFPGGVAITVKKKLKSKTICWRLTTRDAYSFQIPQWALVQV